MTEPAGPGASVPVQESERSAWLREIWSRSIRGENSFLLIAAMFAIVAIFVLPGAIARLAELSTLVGVGP